MKPMITGDKIKLPFERRITVKNVGKQTNKITIGMMLGSLSS